MGNTYITASELEALEERRIALEVLDRQIAAKNSKVVNIRDYKGVEYGMTQYGYYQVLFVKGNESFPIELTGSFTHPNVLIKLVDDLIKEGKVIELK